MTTYRELLELAARAAGYSDFTEWSDKITDYDSRHWGRPALHKSGAGGECLSWNPLVSDGDALRLAVKLKIGISGSPSHIWACKLDICDIHEPRGNDPYAATRRAIVRVAAEIGKRMP